MGTSDFEGCWFSLKESNCEDDGQNEYHPTGQQNPGIEQGAYPFTMLTEAVADQSWLLLPVHNVMTGIQAATAVDALYLVALANVDAHWTDPDTGLAINTAVMFRVGKVQGQRGLIDQGALEASVGAKITTHQPSNKGQIQVKRQPEDKKNYPAG